MKKNIINLVATAIAALSIFASCTSQKTMAKLDDKTSRRAVQEQFGAAIQNAFDYKCLQSKVKFSYKGKTLPARLNVEQGKQFRLILNAPLLGFELGRIEVDRDSVTIVNKMDKLYATEAIDDARILADAGLNVEALQCLFLGRVYVPGRGEAHVGDYRRLSWTRTAADNIEGIYNSADYAVRYTIDSEGRVRNTEVTIPDKDIRVTWDYTDYLRLQTGTFPTEQRVSLQLSKNEEAGISLASPNLNAGKWDPFDPEDKYQRVTMSELWSRLKTLLNK